MILVLIVIGLVIYFEPELVKTMLAPLITVFVATAFIVLLAIVIVVELALMIIAPAALLLGYESRGWHRNMARKLMLGDKDESITD